MNNLNKQYKVFDCHKDVELIKCASLVMSGGVIVYPTDTTYGIGCNPYNDKSVERIFNIKGRNKNKPLPILASSIQDIEKIVSLGKIGELLARAYWPGALTIISSIIDENISTKVTSGKMSIGVRIPNNKCILSLLRHCKYLVGTSANKSGENPATNPFQIISSSLHGFDALLDAGTVERGVESTIVDLTDLAPKIIRERAITSQEIYKVLDGIRLDSNDFQSDSFDV